MLKTQLNQFLILRRWWSIPSHKRKEIPNGLFGGLGHWAPLSEFLWGEDQGSGVGPKSNRFPICHASLRYLAGLALAAFRVWYPMVSQQIPIERPTTINQMPQSIAILLG